MTIRNNGLPVVPFFFGIYYFIFRFVFLGSRAVFRVWLFLPCRGDDAPHCPYKMASFLFRREDNGYFHLSWLWITPFENHRLSNRRGRSHQSGEFTFSVNRNDYPLISIWTLDLPATLLNQSACPIVGAGPIRLANDFFRKPNRLSPDLKLGNRPARNLIESIPLSNRMGRSYQAGEWLFP